MNILLPLLLSALIAASPLQAASLPAQAPETPPAVEIAQEKTVLELPYTTRNTAVLYRWDGSAAASVRVPLTVWPDKSGLWDLLSQVKGHAVTGWAVPDDPWPIYSIRVPMSAGDYVIFSCGGVWTDNFGNTLRTEADFPAIWDRFAKDPQAAEAPALPLSQLLALGNGTWDPRFLEASDVKELLPDVPMTIKSEQGKLTWTLANRSGQTLSHANGAAAVLEVLLDGAWYEVPKLDGPHWAVTAEGHILRPEEDYAYRVWQEAYGDLPEGTYRLILPLDTDMLPGSRPIEPYGCAGVSFRLGAGWKLLPENAGSHSS